MTLPPDPPSSPVEPSQEVCAELTDALALAYEMADVAHRLQSHEEGNSLNVLGDNLRWAGREISLLRQALTACQQQAEHAEQRYQAEHESLSQAVAREVENRERAEAAEARLLALTFQPGPSDPQAPDPPHTRPDYADCWQSGWRTGYAVARDSAEARLLVQEGEIARLRELKESAVEILKRFKESEANGASTRDRRYVIDILEFSLGREQANG